MEQRLAVHYLKKWAEPDECGECDPYKNEYDIREFKKSLTGEQKAKRFYSRQVNTCGYASLTHEQYNPDHIIDPPYKFGAWEEVEEWNGNNWVTV